MSKTLEEIQAEIAAAAAAMNGAAGPDAAPSPEAPASDAVASAAAGSADVLKAVDLGTTADATGQLQQQEAAATPSTAELLELLAAKSGVSIEQLLNGLDAAMQAAGQDPGAVLLPEGTKTYYSSIPNIGIMVQVGPANCERVNFAGDTLHTTDAAVIAYLDSIVDKPGSGIFSQSHRQVTAEVTQMRAEVQEVARRAHARMVAAGEKV